MGPKQSDAARVTESAVSKRWRVTKASEWWIDGLNDCACELAASMHLDCSLQVMARKT
jgi:hypothetical protein